jgi:hypothetical protein
MYEMIEDGYPTTRTLIYALEFILADTFQPRADSSAKHQAFCSSAEACQVK